MSSHIFVEYMGELVKLDPIQPVLALLHRPQHVGDAGDQSLVMLVGVHFEVFIRDDSTQGA